MNEAELKTCPFCKEQIRQEAVKCRFCGEWLESGDKATVDSPPEPTTIDPSERLRMRMRKKVQPQPWPHTELKSQERPDGTRRFSKRSITWISVALLSTCFAVFVAAVTSLSNTQQIQPLTDAFGKLLVASGALGFAFGRKGYRLLLFSIICAVSALLFAIPTVKVLKQRQSNKQFGSAARAFANDAQRYVEEGGTGKIPAAKSTGDQENDMIGRAMNDLFHEMGPPIASMNAKLNALEMKDVFETSVLNNKANLAAEARKRIQSQEIIEKCRKELPQSIEVFRRKASSYNVADGQKKIIMDALENARSNFLQQSQTMFNLLQRTEKTELDLLNFMSAVFAEYELKNGKLMFQNETSRQQYNELAKSATNATKELESFRKTMLDAQAQNLDRLGR